MSDTGGATKNRFKEPHQKPPRDDCKNLFKKKRKKPEQRDEDIDYDKDLHKS
jgi:hypothetical protein